MTFEEFLPTYRQDLLLDGGWMLRNGRSVERPVDGHWFVVRLVPTPAGGRDIEYLLPDGRVMDYGAVHRSSSAVVFATAPAAYRAVLRHAGALIDCEDY